MVVVYLCEVSKMCINDTFMNLKHGSYPPPRQARPGPRSSSVTDDDEMWRQRRKQHTEEMAMTVERARQRRAEEEKHYEQSKQCAQEKAKNFEKSDKVSSSKLKYCFIDIKIHFIFCLFS